MHLYSFPKYQIQYLDVSGVELDKTRGSIKLSVTLTYFQSYRGRISGPQIHACSSIEDPSSCSVRGCHVSVANGPGSAQELLTYVESTGPVQFATVQIKYCLTHLGRKNRAPLTRKRPPHTQDARSRRHCYLLAFLHGSLFLGCFENPTWLFVGPST